MRNVQVTSRLVFEDGSTLEVTGSEQYRRLQLIRANSDWSPTRAVPSFTEWISLAVLTQGKAAAAVNVTSIAHDSFQVWRDGLPTPRLKKSIARLVKALEKAEQKRLAKRRRPGWCAVNLRSSFQTYLLVWEKRSERAVVTRPMRQAGAP